MSLCSNEKSIRNNHYHDNFLWLRDSLAFHELFPDWSVDILHVRMKLGVFMNSFLSHAVNFSGRLLRRLKAAKYQRYKNTQLVAQLCFVASFQRAMFPIFHFA